MTENGSWPNRRKYPRLSVNLPVTYSVSGTKKALKPREDRLITIGAGGGFIQAKLTYPKDTKLKIEFSFEGRKIEAVASVRYAVPFVPKVGGVQYPGMGFEFVEVEEKQRAFIQNTISKIKEK